MVMSEQRLYTLSYLGLLLLLAATVGFHKLSLGWIGMLLSLLIALAKAGLVLWNFMELRIAQRTVYWILGATFFLVYIALLLSFSDYLTRGPS